MMFLLRGTWVSIRPEVECWVGTTGLGCSPQESTGFAPFELLYGRRVRGPLDVLKEVWTGEEMENTSVAAHVIQMRERLQEMSDLARSNLAEAQKKQKRYYDEKAQLIDAVITLLRGVTGISFNHKVLLVNLLERSGTHLSFRPVFWISLFLERFLLLILLNHERKYYRSLT